MVDGRDVTAAFAKRSNGRVQGVVTGLKVGDNVLTASLPNATGARLTLSNYPIGGPVFAGAQQYEPLSDSVRTALSAAVRDDRTPPKRRNGPPRARCDALDPPARAGAGLNYRTI